MIIVGRYRFQLNGTPQETVLGVCVFTSAQGLLRLREVWDIFASNILYILSLLQNLMIVVWNSRETS